MVSWQTVLGLGTVTLLSSTKFMKLGVLCSVRVSHDTVEGYVFSNIFMAFLLFPVWDAVLADDILLALS